MPDEILVDKSSTLTQNFFRELDKPPQKPEEFERIVVKYFMPGENRELMLLEIDSFRKSGVDIASDKEWQDYFRSLALTEYTKLMDTFQHEPFRLGLRL
jgi:hypothetical protein